MLISPEEKQTQYDIAIKMASYNKWLLSGAPDMRHSYLIMALKRSIEKDLTEKQRDYLLLYMKGVKQKEISLIYGVNQSTVTRTLSRAKKRIYRSLAPVAEFFEYSK